MDNIDIFNDSAIILEKKVPKKIISWITLLIILTILFCSTSFITFNIYKSYIATYDGRNIEIYDYDFPLNKNYKLYIEQKAYDYTVSRIDSNSIILNVNLDSDLKINNNILTVNILKDRTSLFNILKNKWKEVFFDEKN